MSTDWKAAYEDVLADVARLDAGWAGIARNYADEIKRLREHIMALEADLHVYHAYESLQWSRRAPDMDECPRCAVRRPDPTDRAAGSDG